MVAEQVADFLRGQGCDEETCAFLVAAVEDAEPDEWREIAEPFLRPDVLNAFLGLAPARAARTEPRPLQGQAALPRMQCAAGPAPGAGPEPPGPAEGEDAAEFPAAVAKGGRGRGRGAAKPTGRAAKARAKQPAAEAPGRPAVEITSQVSRFHRELVENEVTSAVSEVDVHDLTMVVAGTTLLDGAHLKLMPGQRYGFVGRNGCGKSTLLRAMEEKQIPGYPPNCVTLLVSQEDVGDDRTPVETVLSGVAEYVSLAAEERVLLPCLDGSEEGSRSAVRAHGLLQAQERLRRAAAFESKSSGQRGREARKALLEAEAEEREAAAACDREGPEAGAELEAQQLLADVRERLRALDVGALRARAEVLLRGLGLAEEALGGPTVRLSGGWRMRIALAKALFTHPDVLLLDEPTNHLDWAATLWLERYLQTSDMEGVAVVVVSHDRTFLDNVCTMILRAHEKQLHLHMGNYSTFEEAHRIDQEGRAELAAKVAEKRAIAEKKVKEMEQKGRATNNDNLLKQVASRRTKMGVNRNDGGGFNRVGLEGANGQRFKASYASELTAEAAMTTESTEAEVKLKVRSAVLLGNDAAMLQCTDVVVGYDRKQPLVAKFDLDIRMGSRIALLGVNGSGKTTLLQVLTKNLDPLGGEVYQQPRVVVAHFNQHQAEGLPLELSGLEVLRDRFPDATEGDIRGHLGSFGMGRQAVQPIHTLSGGEKVRIALAAITFRPPHILLLDEPTNHLDLQTVEALGKALQDFEGGLVIASHDRRLLKDVCTDFYGIQGRKLQKTALADFVKAVRSGAAAAK